MFKKIARPNLSFIWIVTAIALAARFAFLAFWRAKDLSSFYGQDLYYSLALHWIGKAPWIGMDVSHPPLYTAFIAAVLW